VAPFGSRSPAFKRLPSIPENGDFVNAKKQFTKYEN
jgi:hypothetical protein